MSKHLSKTCVFAVLIMMLAIVFSGCNQPPAVNPWRDDVISISESSTASQDGVLAANRQPVIRQRDFPEVVFAEHMPATPHYPLWWEDPFEDKGDGDGDFAVTWADYLAMPYGFGRYLLNTMAWPVSAVVTPPGTPMVSDGRITPGKDHDAKPGTSPLPRARGDFGHFVSEPIPPLEMENADSTP